MRYELREAYRAWLVTRPDLTRFGVTLVYDGGWPTLDRAKHDLHRWAAAVNRRLFGPRWRKKRNERLIGVAFAEAVATNPHWHAVANVERPLDQLAAAAETAWRAVTKGRGNARVMLNASPAVAAWYATKRFDSDHPEGWVEFLL